METFSALLAICAGNSGEFPTQRPVTQSFDVYFDLRPNKRLSINNREAGDLRRHLGHYDVNVMHDVKEDSQDFNNKLLSGTQWITGPGEPANLKDLEYCDVNGNMWWRQPHGWHLRSVL